MDGTNQDTAAVVRELTAEIWPDLEELFGRNGACDGCWCQWWRIAGVERWNDVKGEVAHARLCRQVQEGSAHGVVAYDDGKPVGWCAFEPWSAFPRLQRSRSLKGLGGEGAWFVGCFFVEQTHRHRGVAELMLDEALRLMKRDGAQVVLACPKDTHGKTLPDAFVYVGTRTMFEHRGFVAAEGGPGAKVLRKRVVVRPDESAGARRS